MTTLISLDLGFDRKALPKEGNQPSEPESQDFPLLRYGFTKPGEDGNPVGLASHWHRGYGMLVTLYDLTEESGLRPQIEHLSLSLRFEKAREQRHRSPVAHPGAEPPLDPAAVSYQRFAIYPAVKELEYSTVFEGRYPNWQIYPPDEDSPAYPGDQYRDARQPPKPCFEVIHAGSFYYTVMLRVQVAGEAQKTFRVDPEMVVDNNGGAIPEDF